MLNFIPPPNDRKKRRDKEDDDDETGGDQEVIHVKLRNLIMSVISKPIICIGKNKGADQLCSNCEADQRLCFCYTDSTIPLLSKTKISSL